MTKSSTSHHLDSTIVACATALGQSAIAIVRMSGPMSKKIIKNIWHSNKDTSLKDRELTLGWIIEKGEKIDQAMVVVMPSPHSFTGEDVVEIHLHGSMSIVQKTIELCLENGAQLAENGEFSKRAYLNGKLDLSQAEAIAELIASNNSRIMRLASKQLAGELSQNIKSIKQRLLNTAAHISASLDFSEEDIEMHDNSRSQTELTNIQDTVSQLLEGSDNLAVVRDGYHVALVGLPNAGKSTLLNKLVGYDRSIVTDIAGTTRDTITESIMLSDTVVQLTDTAGLHSSRDKVEKLGIKRTIDEIKNSDLVLVLVEPDKHISTEKFLVENNIDKYLDKSNCIVVHTKSDVIQNNSQSRDFFDKFTNISISTQENKGIEQLKSAIIDHSKSISNTVDLRLITNRQIELLKKLQEKIQDIKSKLQQNTPADILSVELQSSIRICNEITGEEATEEIINQVFSNFCIGK